jgi:hypothetical protein
LKPFPLRCSRFAFGLLLLGFVRICTCTAHAQWVAYNDHGGGLHPNVTTFKNSGALRNVDTGANLPVTLTITNRGFSDSFSSGAAITAGPAAGTFAGFVEFSGEAWSSTSTNGAMGHTLSGLKTNATYSLKGSGNRGEPSYTGRWTLFELAGARSFRNAHSAGCLTNDPAKGIMLASNQVALCTGYNTVSGAMFNWEDVVPGDDGRVTIITRKYLGPLPDLVNDVNGTLYSIGGLRVQEFVAQPPTVFAINPAAAERCAGSDATIAVSFSGTSPLSFQWQRATATTTNDVLGANHPILTLSNLAAGDFANYRVVISNAFGVATSEWASITPATTPIAWVNEPKSVTNYPGETVQFTANINASAAGPVNVQWFHVNESGTTNALANGTNGTLSFAAAFTNAGAYFVHVQNCLNALTSRVVTLTVPVKPVSIAVQPPDATITVGSNGTLAVMLDGTTPQIQWFRNGALLPDATNATIAFNTAQFSDSGLYSAVASNAMNAVTTRVAVVSIVRPSYVWFNYTNLIWRYNQSGADLGTDWRKVNYPLAMNWPQGRGGFGLGGFYSSARPFTNTALAEFGTNGLDVLTYYYRTEVVLTNEPSEVSLATTAFYDAGAAVFVNGVEAARHRLPLEPIVYSTPANLFASWAFVNGTIPGRLLKRGTNVIAIEVHQSTTDPRNSAMLFSATVQFVPSSLLAITNHPQSIATAELRPVALSLGYTGTAAVVRWFKQEAGGPVLMSAGAATTLDFPQPLAGVHDGSYFVTLSNSVAHLTSSVVTLTVTQAAPTIVVQPRSQDVAPAGTVALEVAAHGSADATFQWWFGNAPIANATNSTYVIAPANTTDTGLYSVVVSNSLGVVGSSNALVNVTPLPVLPAPLLGEGASVGTTARFVASPAGWGPFTFQWQFNGTNLLHATNSALVITNVQLAHEGLYRVLIGNSNGVITSEAVPLVVSLGAALNQPGLTWVTRGTWAIESDLAHDGVAAARSLGFGSELEAQVVGPARIGFWFRPFGTVNSFWFLLNNRLVYSTNAEGGWQRYETLLPAGTNLLRWSGSGFSSEANSSVLLDEVSITTNDLGPRIQVPPISRSVLSGSDSLFEVTAEGAPPLHYEWRHNGILVGQERVFVVTNAQPTHEGTWTVTVSNVIGTTSAEAVFTVSPSAPQIAAVTRVHAVPDRDTFLHAQARGSEPMTYQWSHNGVALPGATNAVLVLPVGSTEWPGQYTVAVTNAFGGSVSQPMEIVPSQATRVIHITMDGLGSKYLIHGLVREPERFPSLQRMMREGAFTLNARCDYTHSTTVPNHLCMLMGRPVLQPTGQLAHVHHGYVENATYGASATIHNSGNTNVPYFSSVFDVVHDHGGKTAFLATKSSLDICHQSYSASAGAPDHVPPDDGTKKLDLVFRTSSSAAVVDAYMPFLQTNAHNYAFLHFLETDSIGHSQGWGSPQWFSALATLDAQLGRILTVLDAGAPNTVVIVTADHGGEGFTHTNAALSSSHTIPMLVRGPGFSPGVDLHTVFANRADPGTNYLDYDAVWQPMRNGDAANLALTALGLPFVPGATLTPLLPTSTPEITTHREGASVTLEWTAAASGFVLEWTSTADPTAAWLPVPGNIVTNVNSFRYAIPAEGPERFFRLRRLR